MKGVDHIGIAVLDIEKAIQNYIKLFGAKVVHDEVVASQKLRAVFIKTGKQKIELITPMSALSPVYSFLKKRGEGVHHVAYKTKDILKEMARLKNEGYRLVYKEPVIGAANKWVNFIHPKDANGVLIELCQKRDIQ